MKNYLIHYERYSYNEITKIFNFLIELLNIVMIHTLNYVQPKLLVHYTYTDKCNSCEILQIRRSFITRTRTSCVNYLCMKNFQCQSP